MEIINQESKRPDFLGAICILSFIGLGWRIFRSSFEIVGGFFTSAFSPVLDDVVQDLKADADPATGFASQVVEAVQHLLEHITTIGFLRMLLSILALIGVFMMWNLKKAGFYLYTAFRILLLLVPVMVLGFNIISLSMLASGIVFAALFIILYGINLRYMN
jgi:hypothetical protein